MRNRKVKVNILECIPKRENDLYRKDDDRWLKIESSAASGRRLTVFQRDASNIIMRWTVWALRSGSSLKGFNKKRKMNKDK